MSQAPLAAAARWLLRPVPRMGARVRLFCFPCTGAGASVYGGWPRLLPEDVEICSVQPPGRENRFREPPFDRMGPLVEAAVEGLLPALDRPFAFFGHSLGALVAFELARTLRRRERVMPSKLLVSACPAPGRRRAPSVPTAAGDDALVARIRRLGRTPDCSIDSPEWRRAYLPLLRADFSVADGYRYAPAAPLALPLVAYGGSADHGVPPAALENWRRETTASFRMAVLPGGHFHLHDHVEPLLADIARELAAL